MQLFSHSKIAFNFVAAAIFTSGCGLAYASRQSVASVHIAGECVITALNGEKTTYQNFGQINQALIAIPISKDAATVFDDCAKDVRKHGSDYLIVTKKFWLATEGLSPRDAIIPGAAPFERNENGQDVPSIGILGSENAARLEAGKIQDFGRYVRSIERKFL